MDNVGALGKISIDRNKILGKGSNGTCVYRGHFEDSIPVAVKRMVYTNTTDVRNMENEVNTLKKLDHPNVVRYRLYDKDKDFIYIVLDLCDATLTECVKHGKLVRITDESHRMKFKIKILKDILQGLDYIHKMDVIHRDLKPQNVLVKRNITSEFSFSAVIADFGLSLEIQEGRTHVTATEAGSKGWKPKEVLVNGPGKRKGKGKPQFIFRKSMDIFSFGCVAHFVMSKLHSSNPFVHPFGPVESRESDIVEANRVAYLNNPTQPVNSELDLDLLGDIMIEMCVNTDPTARPEAEELLHNPLFWSYTTKLHFVEKVFNDFKDKFDVEPVVKDLEQNWTWYHPLPFTSKIPEAWGYHLFCRKSKPSEGTSLFNDLLRNIRNIQQHCIEATGRYTQTHKHPGSDHETKLEEVLGDRSDEDIGRYFFGRIPVVLPVVYLSLYLHARERNVLQEYYKNKDLRGNVEGRVQAALDTLDI